MKSVFTWLHGKGVMPCWQVGTKQWWLEIVTLEKLRHKFEDAIERGRYGVSRRDCWSLDSYLCRVNVNGLETLRRWNHGHPACVDEWFEDVGPEDYGCHDDMPSLWAAIMTAMIDGFKAHEILVDSSWAMGKWAHWPDDVDEIKATICAMDHNDPAVREYLDDVYQLGMELYTEYFGALWD